MKRVLFICYFFPPSANSAAMPAGKFAQYLPAYGWEPVVLTVKEIGYRFIDESRREPWLESLTVHRVHLSQHVPVRWRWSLRAREPLLGWLGVARRLAGKLIRREKIDAVWSTFGPSAPHLVAEQTARRHNLPWVADFRDEWTLNPDRPLRNPIRRRLERGWERRVLKRAEVLTITNAGMEATFNRAYPEFANKWRHLPNGFDSTDFDFPSPDSEETDCRLVHVGTLYGERVAAAKILLQRWQAHSRDLPSRGRRFVFDFIGNVEEGFRAFAAALALPAHTTVRCSGVLPRTEALQRMSSAKVLLLFTRLHHSEGELSGKLFEYLAARRPILCVTPAQSATAAVLANTRGGEVFDPTEAAWPRLYEFVSSVDQGRYTSTICREAVARYEWRNLAGELAAALDEAETRHDGNQS